MKTKGYDVAANKKNKGDASKRLRACSRPFPASMIIISHLQGLIINVRKELPISDSVSKMMKTFVIQAIYEDNKSGTPGEAKSVK